MAQERDSHGRFKADHRNRNIAIGTATAIGAIAAGIASALHFGLFDRLLGTKEGHAAPDLTGDRRPEHGDRAPVDFRPDATAPVTAAEREALRPATGTGPSIIEAAGSMNSQTAPANG